MYQGTRGQYEVQNGQCFLTHRRTGKQKLGKSNFICLLEREPRNAKQQAWQDRQETLMLAYALEA